MATTSINYASEILKANLREIDDEDKRIDEDYTARKRKTADRRRQIHKALELLNDNNKEIVTTIPEKRGRKAQPFNPTQYPYDGSFRNKILFAIHDAGRFIHVREIAATLIAKEASLDTNDLVEVIGRSMWKIKTSGAVIQFQAGTSLRNTFYGLPTWVNSDGSIKMPYMYRPEALIDKEAKGALRPIENSIFD